LEHSPHWHSQRSRQAQLLLTEAARVLIRLVITVD